MKTHWAAIIFAAGLGAGWLIPHDASNESPKAAGDQSAAPVVRKREARPVTTPRESKFRSLAKELPKLSAEELAAFKKSLAPEDRAAAIDALLAEVGPEGISPDANFLVQDILKTWVGEDIDGAWVWCQQIEGDANRGFVASKLLNSLVNRDPDRAFALHLEMAAEFPYFHSNVPGAILKQAVSKDAASFLDLLGKLAASNKDVQASGMPAEFAADFDFQQAADGVTALSKNRGGKSPPVFPTNFVSNWAARDADAAYAWFAKNENVTYEKFGSLLEGVEKQGVPGASYAWTADKLEKSGTARDAIIRGLAQFDSERKTTTINSIAQAMPDDASRDRFLGDVLAESCPLNAPAVEFSYAVNQMSTPEARLEALQRLGRNGQVDAAKISDEQLQQWGLTRQQLEQAARR